MNGGQEFVDAAKTEGLKMIAEWCKWLVAVQSGAIGLIATLIKTDGRLELGQDILMKRLLGGSVVCFVVSILLTGAIFGSIPSALTDIGEDERVMNRPIIVFNAKFGVFWFFIPLLFIFFLAGIGLFAGSLLRVICV